MSETTRNLPPHLIPGIEAHRASVQKRTRRKANRRKSQKKTIRRLIKRQQGLCAYCFCKIYERSRNRLPYATVDHVIPISRGGTNAPTNLVAACARCNFEKSNMMPDEYREFKDGQIDDIIVAMEAYAAAMEEELSRRARECASVDDRELDAALLP